MRFAEVGLLRGMYKALRAEENIALSSGLSEEVVQQYIDIRIEEFQKWLDDSRKTFSLSCKSSLTKVTTGQPIEAGAKRQSPLIERRNPCQECSTKNGCFEVEGWTIR